MLLRFNVLEDEMALLNYFSIFKGQDGQLLERVVLRCLRGAVPRYFGQKLERYPFFSKRDPDLSAIR